MAAESNRFQRKVTDHMIIFQTSEIQQNPEENAKIRATFELGAVHTYSKLTRVDILKMLQKEY